MIRIINEPRVIHLKFFEEQFKHVVVLVEDVDELVYLFIKFSIILFEYIEIKYEL